MLDEKEAKSIKQQILKQIDSWQTTKEKKQEAKNYIQNLNTKQLEQFLIQNKLIKPKQETSHQQTQEQERQCPLCLIAQEKIQAYKIEENKVSLAVLEINPLSKGHVLIIPKQHKNIDKIPSLAFSLAKKTASRIKRKLKAKQVSIQTSELFNHAAINIIPVYESEPLKKYQASEKELKQVQEKLKGKPKITKAREKKAKQLPKAPLRIP